MPPADEPIAEATRIDISHESLLRGWTKITGTPGKDKGWITQEDSDGKDYRSLLAAQHAGALLPANFVRERQNWWKKTRPNAAWAERYGGEFENVQTYLATNAKRDFRRRAALWGLLVSSFIFAGTTFGIWAAGRVKDLQQDAAYDAVTRENRENLRQLNELKAQSEAQRQQLILAFEESRRALVKQLEDIQKTLPAQTPPNVRAEIDQSVAASLARPDDATQRVIGSAKSQSSANFLDSLGLAGKTGYMWIGSRQKGQLRPVDGGVSIPANTVERNKEYLLATGIYLRSGLPDRKTYAQAPEIGELNEGTRVLVLNVADPFQRPAGDQYWAQVKVITVALPTVYFQFAGSSREQAQQLSQALRDKGYTIPGEERTGAATGKRVVRFFDSDDEAAAKKLAADAQQALQDLGFPRLVVTTELVKQKSKSNPDGNLELWIDMPGK
jgi:hypothetical protein